MTKMELLKRRFADTLLLLLLALGFISCRKDVLTGLRPAHNRNDKVLKVKRRDIDSCEKFIFGYRKRKLDSCISVADLSPFCDKDQCPNKPSPPEAIFPMKMYLNKTTRMIDVEVSWKEPKFGLNNLCGFQLHFASLRGPLYTYCMQFNSKSQHSFRLPRLNFNGKYNITIVSLPAFKNLDESSRYQIFETPEKCEMFKNAGVTPPWQCGVQNNITVACTNGSISVALEKPKSADFSFYFGMILAGDGYARIPIYNKKFSKEQKFAQFSDLPLGLKYVLKIFFMKHSSLFTVYSKPFICEANAPLVTVSPCDNQTVTANWQSVLRPSNNANNVQAAYDYKITPLRRSENIKMTYSSGKLNESLLISNLTKNIDYTIQIAVKLEQYGQIQVAGNFVSDVFSCKDTTIQISKTSREEANEMWLIILPLVTACAFVALFVFACLKLNWAMKAKNACQRHWRAACSSSLAKTESIYLLESAQVLMVYPCGCDCLNELTLLLGQLVTDMGLDCILDLVVHDKVDRDVFILEKLNQLGRKDFVIFLNYTGTCVTSQNALKSHKDAIFSKIIPNCLDSKSLISINFDKSKKTELGHNLNFDKNVLEQLESLVRLLWKVPSFQFGHQLPEKNSVQINEHLKEEIKIATAQVLQSYHGKCCKTSCEKAG